MSDMPSMSRRRFAFAAATGALAATATAAGATSASAYQGNMENALSSLYSALGALRQAEGAKGGHRANAIRLVQQAITETQAGIEVGDEAIAGK